MPASEFPQAAPGSFRTHAVDARAWEVGQLCSTEEAAEQGRIDSAAEVVEGRGLAKGRTLEQNTLRTQSRIKRAK